MEPLHKVFMPKEAMLGIGKVLESGQLGYGQNTRRFELELQRYIKNPNVLTISGNSVLFALKLLDVSKGDEIIVSPMSCLMTTQPIAYLGAKVVWADIDPSTGSLDPISVKSKITSKTKAIIHYHWGGYPGYIDEINSVGKMYGTPVIEDATESFGSVYKGAVLGNTGTDIVCYSFTPVRLPNAIDGGGLAFSNTELYKKALIMRDLGIERDLFRDPRGEISSHCDISLAGDSSLMNDVSGFVGMHQMAYLSELIDKQRKNAAQWECYFQDSPRVNILSKRNVTNPNYWVFTVLADKRDELLVQMRNSGYYASKMHLRNDLYTVFGASNERLDGVSEFSDKQLNITCGWWLEKRNL